MVEIPTHGKVRLDAWLRAVRIYKTRSAATTACRAGHVRLNGDPVKASQIVVPGDRIRVRKDGWDRELEVTGLISKRVGAPVAVKCYLDHTPPREKVVVPQVPIRDRGAGRPTKKDRREMDRLRSSWLDTED
ncbi:RNA-binding S4 domain-containing protein [Glutamicibacter sp. BW77]|uniref:RNA-binding S4 domain-containing protein n=1 Tax=Glutamicibacter sp. BW77 TaxID=2024402 RepID=UPI000BB76AE4|nr:RNA-binding S4 domain-containing protein [Glutamicibacter sp. BW77]PCC35230.1 RNA-binding protein S4 [Glutamicibacter sp. BW77]